MKKLFYILTVVGLLVLGACQKKPEAPDISSKMELGVTTIDTVSYNYANVSGSVIKTGGVEILDYGHCWSTHKDPTVGDNKTSFGTLNQPKSFKSEIKNLTDSTVYYIRSYITYKYGTIYGQESNITTFAASVPNVITSDVTNITVNTAQCGGINDNGGLTIQQRGVCWNTTGNPVLENCLGFTNEGSDMGTFTSNITGLTENTTYYVAAYATNEKGTGYGEINVFTTAMLSLPTVETITPFDITSTTASSGGNITGNGNSTITARGVCWDVTPNPTLGNCLGYTTNGTGIGAFTSSITGLTSNTQYYVKAYTTNGVGTAYGNELDFTTSPPVFQCGDSLVYEGQTYHTVSIGNQCWMKENLNVGTRIDGSLDQTDNNTVEKYCYNDNEANCDIFGGLYQWGEMMQYVTTEGTQGICPDGWHLPNDAEWNTLINYLGGNNIAGGKMKETGTAHWVSPNEGATNESGFTALAGGDRLSDESFQHYYMIGDWFSSTEYSGVDAWCFGLNYFQADIHRNYGYKKNGFSVRCVKD